jgi:hypothetical protein
VLAQVHHDHSFAVVAQKTLVSFQQLTEPRPQGSGLSTLSDELALETLLFLQEGVKGSVLLDIGLSEFLVQ